MSEKILSNNAGQVNFIEVHNYDGKVVEFVNAKMIESIEVEYIHSKDNRLEGFHLIIRKVSGDLIRIADKQNIPTYKEEEKIFKGVKCDFSNYIKNSLVNVISQGDNAKIDKSDLCIEYGKILDKNISLFGKIDG